MSTISNTGFWSAESAHTHHFHCPILASWLADHFKDKKKPLYDFGCGLGHYSKSFNDCGFENVTGFEGDPPVKKVYNKIIRQDLTKPFSVPSTGNVLFLEVAEHIPKMFEKQMLDNVLKVCDDQLVLSWAIVGQAGFGHVNCQDNDYVLDIVESYGFKHVVEKTKEVRNLNLDSAPWFYNTLFCFEK